MANEVSGLITPVILAGGSGTRLWPLSNDERPKQFQTLSGRRSMFQQTLMRIADPGRFTAPIIIANSHHTDLLHAEVAASGIKPAAIVFEPEGRNTTPAITLAAMMVLALRLGDNILVMPSDHAIGNPGKLISAIDKARAAVRRGFFVTFGITPSGPETCYGYIRQGTQLSGGADAADHIADIFHVERFVEKPPRDKAEAMLAEGGYLWNSGMFLFPVTTLLSELNRLQPATVKACQQSLTAARIEGRVVHPDGHAFSGAEAISIDYAVMEKTDRAAVVPTDPLWNDVGSWTSVWEMSDRDQSQNVTIGDVILHDVSGAYVRSEGPLTAVVGLSDVIVVNTGDAVIVAAKSHAQDICRIAEAVKRRSAEAAGSSQPGNAATSLEPAVDESLADIIAMPRRSATG